LYLAFCGDAHSGANAGHPLSNYVADSTGAKACKITQQRDGPNAGTTHAGDVVSCSELSSERAELTTLRSGERYRQWCELAQDE
jgi:hypothetical protein